ncbi:MAG: chloramphenicol acetyltransferase [Candidatus Marinimicrobia bacterium]|nr:chloramphenicol acetyltransferase [Candidatus Neomarinimicrobiota bacterium]
MYKKLNIENWERKDQFFFFKDYDNPFFNICTEVDVTELFNFTKEKELSFFITSLYASIKAVNLVEEFRYRIKDDDVIIYDEIHAGSTVLNEDDTFSFCYFTFKSSFNEFNIEAKQTLQNIIRNKGTFDPRSNQDNLIHYSVIPWISFLSISHARKFRTNDSIPKIVLGKYNNKDNRLMMPISIEVHHSLVDGLHVSKYLNKFQEILNKPKIYL